MQENVDPIQQRLDEVAESMRRFVADDLSVSMKKLARILANAADVPVSGIKRHHIVRFVRTVPEKAILRWRGINRKSLEKIRFEISGDP